MPHVLDGADDLLTPQEVANLFRVDPKTVLRWEKNNKLSSIRTLGGHRRYLKGQVSELLNSGLNSSEVVEALERAHALALKISAARDAVLIAQLLDVLKTPEPTDP